MVIDEEILKRVRDYGSLGHTPRQVAALLRIRHSEIESFVDEMIRSDTRLHEFYESGKAIMSYNMNVELAQQAEKEMPIPLNFSISVNRSSAMMIFAPNCLDYDLYREIIDPASGRYR